MKHLWQLIPIGGLSRLNPGVPVLSDKKNQAIDDDVARWEAMVDDMKLAEHFYREVSGTGKGAARTPWWSRAPDETPEVNMSAQKKKYMELETYTCLSCGSDNIQIVAWVNPNDSITKSMGHYEDHYFKVSQWRLTHLRRVLGLWA